MLKITADLEPIVDSPNVTLALQDGQPLKANKVPKNQLLSANTQEGIRSTLTQGVVHHYLLNDDKACKVMTQNAKRPAIENVNVSSTTTHLQLSTGVFSKVIFPLLTYWKSFPADQVLSLDKVEATLKEVRVDEEENGKIVDALAKLIFKGKKISLFAYSTNQTIMVQGSNHNDFLASFLLPILERNISQKQETIDDYNNMVIRSLSPSRVVLDDSVWSSVTPARGKGLKVKLRRNPATCDQCGRECTNVTTLKVHITNAHSDRTRAKPRVSLKASRQMISVVPPPNQSLTAVAASSPAASAPALTYDADSELLLGEDSDCDSEDSEVEVIGGTNSPSRLEKECYPASQLEVETVSSATEPSASQVEPEIAPSAPKVPGPPLEVDIAISHPMVAPPPKDVEVNEDVQTVIQPVKTDFQCAVCSKCFNCDDEVKKHFESHGNGETVIHLMKEIFNLKSFWISKYDKQQQEISSLKHQLHFMQTSTAKVARPRPASPPAPALPPSSPPALPPSSTEPSQPSSPPAQNNHLPVTRQQPAFRPAPAPKGKRRILYIRDSIHRAVIGPKLENPTGSLMRSVNAYASVHDPRAPANKQHLNVKDVVRRELTQSKGEDTLVLGAPSVDISNQDTSKGVLDENVTETMASSIAMVEIAEHALKTGKVKQVILLEHVVRYDTEAKDKHKNDLANLANRELHKARNASELAQNIFVGRHTGLQCEGSIRASRFTSDHSNRLHGLKIRLGKYDGIHMYSQEGAEALTKSILNIFQKAGLVKNKRSSPSSQRQHNLWASNQTSPESIQGAEHLWTTSQPASSPNQGAGQPWITNQLTSPSIQGTGQYWSSSHPTSSSIQEAEQPWSVQSSRNAWNWNNVNSVEAPVWHIPTTNMFQGFY